MLEGLGSLIWIKSRKGRLPAPFELLNLHTNRESCISKGNRKPPSPQTLAPALILLGLFCCLRMSQNSIYSSCTQRENMAKARRFLPPWSVEGHWRVISVQLHHHRLR